MEGIQHRWDCPVREAAAPDPDTFETREHPGHTHMRCRHCGRAAVIHKPKEETSDDKR